MSETDSVDDVVDDFTSAIDRAAVIVAAKNGNERARERLLAASPMEMTFPGSKQRAMGHALETVEDIEAGGLSAEREYHGTVMEHGAELHQIDIIVSEE